MRSINDRLSDILAAIENIDTETAKGRAAFDADPKNQVWVIHHLRIIGEAVRATADEMKRLSPETPWAEIVGMRHILIHDYFGVDLDEVWNAAVKDIPDLRRTVTLLIQSL